MTDPAELLRDFVNTYDVEKGADELGSPEDLASWLCARGLVAAHDRATAQDLAAAVALREGLRAALRRNHDRATPTRHGRDAHAAAVTAEAVAPASPQATHDPPGGLPAATTPTPAEICTGSRRAARAAAQAAGPAPSGELSALLADLPLRVTLDGPAPALEPVATGIRGGLARIAAAIVEAHAAGTWPRLKVCVEATCQWAFIDSSKNRSRSWCSMRICGNRTKTRAYRARHRAAGGRRPS